MQSELSEAISAFEDAVGRNAQALSLEMEKAPHGLVLRTDKTISHDDVKQVLKEINQDRIEVVSKVDGKGALICAFEVYETQGRAYSVVRVGETKPFPAEHAPKTPAAQSLLQMMQVKYNVPAVFTVLGPEGVGKTTLCEGMEEVFKGYPIPCMQFHHTAAWKAQEREKTGTLEAQAGTTEVKTTSAKTTVPPQRSLPYRMLRGVWRALSNDAIKSQVGGFIGEFTYMENVLRLLTQAHENNRLVIADRYCYDRLVRWRNLKKPAMQRFGSYLTCVFMRKPFYAFILRDTPERIFQRKQTMPMWEIELHQEHLKNVTSSFTERYELVDVSQMSGAIEVRAAVIRKIFRQLGAGVFDLIRLPEA